LGFSVSGVGISDTVDSLDLSAFHVRYVGDGPRNQPFHPAMMVKVLIHGYATGVYSSRKLARKLHEDVAFRVLAAGNFPAHRTLCDFRAHAR
jgi:transposase